MSHKGRDLRCPQHRAQLREFYASQADHREDPYVPKMDPLDDVILEGSWADLPIRDEIGRRSEVRGKKIETPEKVQRLSQRRVARKLKFQFLDNPYEEVIDEDEF